MHPVYQDSRTFVRLLYLSSLYDFPDDVLAVTEVMGTGIMLMMGISIMQKPMPRIEKSYWTKPLGLGHDNWAIARLIRSTDVPDLRWR